MNSSSSIDRVVPINNLRPSEISSKHIISDDDRKLAEKALDDWYNDLNGNLNVFMKNNGIKTFVVSFIHEGMNTPMIINSENMIDTCKLSVLTANEMQGRVIRASGINLGKS